MSTYNFRLAQTTDQNVAPSFVFRDQSIPAASTTAPIPSPQKTNTQPSFLQNPSGATFGLIENQIDPKAKADYKKYYDNTKNTLTNGFLQIPETFKYNPNVYNWAVQFINALIKNYDNIIILIIEKGYNIATWIKNPYLAGLIKAAEKNPEKYQIVKSVGQKIFSKLANVKGIKNIVGLVDAARDVKYNSMISSLGADDLDNLFIQHTDSTISPAKVKQFLKNPKSVPFSEQKEIMKFINQKAPNSYGKLAKTLNFNEIISTGTRLGENASIYKQAAVKTFRGMELAMPKIAGFVEKATPFLDVLVSSADFIDWLRVWKNTGWSNLPAEDKSKFMMSALKALATVCYFIPGLQPFAILINTVIAIVQTVGVDVAENLGYAAGGMGIVGGKETMEKLQQISEATAGSEPKDPGTNAQYQLIKQWIYNDLVNNPNVQKGKNLRQFIDEYVLRYYNQQKDKNQVSWMKNPSDPRTLELYNALSMVLKTIQKERQQKATKANKVYNNRRYVTCPSI